MWNIIIKLILLQRYSALEHPVLCCIYHHRVTTPVHTCRDFLMTQAFVCLSRLCTSSLHSISTILSIWALNNQVSNLIQTIFTTQRVHETSLTYSASIHSPRSACKTGPVFTLTSCMCDVYRGRRN